MANRPDWLADPEHWQGVARSVEDKLSDALHERLTERFVDRRTSVLMRRLRENTTLETEIKKDRRRRRRGPPDRPARRLPLRRRRIGGRLRGQDLAGRRAEGAGRRDRRARDQAVAGARRAVRAVVRRHDALDRRAGRQARSPATMCCGRACASSPTSSSPARRARRCRRGSISGSRRTSSSCSAPLFALAAAEDVTGIARGIAFQLIESLGVLERQKVAEDVKGLDQAVARGAAQVRRALRRLSPLSAGAAEARAAQPRGPALGAQARRARTPRASTSCSGSRRAAAPRSRSTRRRRRRSTAPSAIASAASAPCASIFWSGSPT